LKKRPTVKKRKGEPLKKATTFKNLEPNQRDRSFYHPGRAAGRDEWQEVRKEVSSIKKETGNLF